MKFSLVYYTMVLLRRGAWKLNGSKSCREFNFFIDEDSYVRKNREQEKSLKYYQPGPCIKVVRIVVISPMGHSHLGQQGFSHNFPAVWGEFASDSARCGTFGRGRRRS
jgi:hypothetical protein